MHSQQCGIARNNSALISTAAIEIANIPAGADCSVTSENDPAAIQFFTWTGKDLGSHVTADVTPPTITVNNTLARDTGSFKIIKTITNPDHATIAQTSFSVDWKCTLNSVDTTGTASINTTTATTVPNIPAGSSCSVTSEVAPTAIPYFTWGNGRQGLHGHR